MKRSFLIFFTLSAFFIFGATLVGVFVGRAESEIYVPAVAEAAPAGDVDADELPARLIIPSLKINADVQHVGIGASGNMAVPSNYSDVGWYRYGTVPGHLGSAVMDGHVDNAFGLPGVFKDLVNVEEGADVYVETKDGKRHRYVVTAVKKYHYKDVPTDVIFNAADAGRLNLITCAGAWIQSEKSYDERVVVYTILVE